MPAADVVGRVGVDAMIEAAVVPYHQVPLAPLVPITKARIVHQRENLVKDRVGSVRRRAGDTQGEAGRNDRGRGVRSQDACAQLADQLAGSWPRCARLPRRAASSSAPAKRGLSDLLQ